MTGPGRVLLGVSGWSYADWVGIVYPRSGAQSLVEVARLVDFIEINSSFYRTPSLASVAGWVERTGEFGTRFTAKLPQEITHAGGRDDGLACSFAEAFAPLRQSGRLDALLAQFSFRFRADAAAREHLMWIRDRFASLAPLLLEVRDGSWRRPEAQALAAELGLRLVALDYPGADRGFAVPDHVSDDLAYYRLHGRNTRAWFDKDAGRDATYDHLYTAAETDELTRRIDELAKATRTLYVAANNHFRGQAVKIALELAAWRDGGRVEVPQSMVDAYPELGSIAKRAQGSLFGE